MENPYTPASADMALSRSRMYRLLARIWQREVDEELWHQLQLAAFPRVPENPRLDEGYQLLRKTTRNASDSTSLNNLSVDYAALCLGAMRKDGADPYESVHLSESGILMQDQWEQILRLYAELDLIKSEKTKEYEDHLAMELECMNLLCGRQAVALEKGDAEDAAKWIAYQKTMLDEHLLRWVPRFVEKVLKLARMDFYKAVAIITNETLKMDRNVLDIAE